MSVKAFLLMRRRQRWVALKNRLAYSRVGQTASSFPGE